MGLGGFPDVGLAAAREKARTARDLVEPGIDPILQRKQAKSLLRAQQTAAKTFAQCAAIDMFCAMLGTVAGNLALTLGAKGGIFIAGGILRHMPEYLARSQFRARFEDKGRLREYLEPIPVWLILDDDAAFVGLHALAEVEGIG